MPDVWGQLGPYKVVGQGEYQLDASGLCLTDDIVKVPAGQFEVSLTV